MIIDDSEVLLEMTRQVLCDIYELFTFSQSPEAILQMRQISPDMVLLDYEMPNLNGLQIIRWMRENEALKDIPVIFLTSYQDVKFELEAFKLGAVDYVHKPFAPALLLKRIEVHLEHAERQANLLHSNGSLLEELEEKAKIIKELQYAIVFTLSDLVEMRDKSTGGHILRTTEYYKLILDYIKDNDIYPDLINGINMELVLEAAQLHDIGKVAIPDAILLKPARLTHDEFETMKTHTLIGYNAILKAMQLTHSREFLNIAAVVALTHHERWDGTGYPHSLEGDAIPLVGRIMAVVDV
ncbi:MAG: response regulator, partial [Oscillospiraceae bacterium]